MYKPFEAIAIVGQACILPDANDSKQLLNNTLEQRSSLSKTREDRFGVPLDDFYPHDQASADKCLHDIGGYVKEHKSLQDLKLDQETELLYAKLDPLFSWTTKCAADALRSANFEMHHLPGNSGLILGNLSYPTEAMSRLGAELLFKKRFPQLAEEHRRLFGETHPLDRFMSGLPAQLAAQTIGLNGHSFALDAACASSLYAVAYACDALHSRKASLMLAGAVNRADALFLHAGFSSLQALSPSGQSQPFSSDADGLIPGEGAGFLALMRLEDALAQSRPIQAVIRGIGLSNDGRAKSLLAPSAEGQVRCMQQAYQKAQISPQSIQWIECHATGTNVGDKTELEAMHQVFSNSSKLTEKHYAIGSLKANIGHLITAAGISGTIRTIEAMKQKIIPPQKAVTNQLDLLQGSIFYLPKEATPWTRPSGHPRRAAVSAFGFGGNNAHLILEDYEKRGSNGSTIHQVHTNFENHAEIAGSEIVVVGIAAQIGALRNLSEIAQRLQTDTSNITGRKAAWPRLENLDFEAKGLRFPPNDIKQALAQQIALLQNARDLETQLPEALFSGERSGCFIGMGCDLDVTSPGIRWRLSTLLNSTFKNSAFKNQNKNEETAPNQQLKACISEALNAQSVLGKMPNIPANRLQVQFDMRGHGHTVSSEEFSGLSALMLAINALNKHELDFALVGASDFNDDLRQEALSAYLLENSDLNRSDASILFALMRKSDAEKINATIWCQIDKLDLVQSPLAFVNAQSIRGSLQQSLTQQQALKIPASHAVSGLATIFEAILSYKETSKNIEITGMSGQKAQIHLSALAQKHPLPAAKDFIFKTSVAAHPDLELFLRELKQHNSQQPAAVKMPTTKLQARFHMPQAPSLLNCKQPSPALLAKNSEELKAYISIMSPAPALNQKTIQPPTALRVEKTQSQTIKTPIKVQQVLKQETLGSEKYQTPYNNQVLAQLSCIKTNMSASHSQFLELQKQSQQQFLKQMQLRQNIVLSALGLKTLLQPATPAVLQSRLQEVQQPSFAPTLTLKKAQTPKTSQTITQISAQKSTFNVAASKEIMFTRAQLESLASDTISKTFGPLFERQDHFKRQVRMPEPPLLLCDRVLKTDAKPGILEKGKTMQTESDVTWDQWYIQNGRIPAGILIESGQADLLLISYMGVDFNNKGERIYRLLGCDLEYFGELPEVGALLHYDIHIDGFANMGETTMFFFHSDCRIGGPDGEIVLSVRHGQAGFFTDEELSNSNGVLWSPKDIDISELQKINNLDVQKWGEKSSKKSSFTEQDLKALNAGDAFACFADGFEMTQCHVRTPRLYHPSHNSDYDLHFVDRITEFSPLSGPWQRGYLRAELDLSPQSWFYDGHFKDDPCMPGTLMFEGCLQVMSFYLLALGLGIDKDAYRFEPMMQHVFPLRCRGQATPSSKKLVYEIFVRKIEIGDAPKIYADLLITVDGLKALHCENAALSMQFDYPLSSKPEMLGFKSNSKTRPTYDAVGGIAHPADKSAVYNQASLLATGWGKPSEAFKNLYECYDNGSKIPRLPGPPYHFMSRVSSLTGPEIGAFKAGNEVVVDYDVPVDAWYFQEHSWQTMPFAILLEIALQPCGWLSSYTGSALQSDEPLYYRNLDGNGVFHRMIMPDVGTLQTKAKMLSVSSSAGMIIQSFELEVTDKNGPIFTGDTVFGFFPEKALKNQLGINKTKEEEAFIAQNNPQTQIDLISAGNPFTGFEAHQIAPEKMLMIDCIESYEATGGKHSLGKILAKKKICPSQWFFKAHFFQDPVQPGSLGIEAILQTLMWWVQKEGKIKAGQKLSPLILGEPISWKYRGQVVPTNKEVSIEVDIISCDDQGMLAEAYLWVDGLRIYHTKKIGLSFLS